MSLLTETLRYYPPSVMIDRGCVKDYKIPDTEFTLRKDQYLIIPILGLHRDEKYWPEPDKFIPERFSPENKANINQYAYLPFGQGPRNCMGNFSE
jgi:cytochrome P450 family 6